MKNLIRLLLIGVFLSLPLMAHAGDPVVTFDDDDPAMNTAMEQARSTLDIFLTQVINEKGALHTDATLKVAFKVTAPDYSDEIIWVSDISRTPNGSFTAYLANEPNYMENKRLGSEVRFTADQIRDWGYFDTDGRLYGHYTTRVLVKRLHNKQAKPILEVLSDKPMPKAWKTL